MIEIKVDLNKLNTTQIFHTKIGGIETTIANHPHQLVMFKGSSFACGGSILSTQWALTAAHCLEERPIPTRVQFRAGSTDRSAGGLIVTASEYHLHPDYSSWTVFYDAAVVKVFPSFVGINIKPIALPASGTELVAGSSVTITGWGRTVSFNKVHRKYFFLNFDR